MLIFPFIKLPAETAVNKNKYPVESRFGTISSQPVISGQNCYSTPVTEFTIKSAVHSVRVKVSVTTHLGGDIVHKCNWNLKLASAEEVT